MFAQNYNKYNLRDIYVSVPSTKTWCECNTCMAIQKRGRRLYVAKTLSPLLQLTLWGNGALAYTNVPLGSPKPAAGSAMKWTHVYPSVKTHPRTGGNGRLPSSTIFLPLLATFLGSSAGLTKSLKSFRSCWQCISMTGSLKPGSHSPPSLEMSSSDGFVKMALLKEGSWTWQDSTILALERQ